ncbi:MAG: hypothetical protein ACYDG5_03255 [Dehalococcoidales bacterium]
MPKRTIKPQTPNDIEDILNKLKDIKCDLKEQYYMTIGAVSLTLIVSALANRIMLITVQDVSNAVLWATHTMVIIGVIGAGIAWCQWQRFKHRKVD